MDLRDDIRALYLIKSICTNFALDLCGLTVLTECANGAYAYTAALAAHAGAEIIVVGRDSNHGRFIENKRRLTTLLESQQMLDRCTIFHDDVPLEYLQRTDIVTNLGFVRPITAGTISRLKPSAVIALMWETWEFRTADLDLPACQARGIPVIGTNEGNPILDFMPYVGMTGVKLLLELGLEVHDSVVALIGGGPIANAIASTFRKAGVRLVRFNADGSEGEPGHLPLDSLGNCLGDRFFDALICAEHIDQREMLGPSGPISFTTIKNLQPHLRFGHICGRIDRTELALSGLPFYPETIADFGRMSYQPGDLGLKPVLLLHAAGLKVGEIAARARLSGASLEMTIARTVESGWGQDFPGGFAGYSPGQDFPGGFAGYSP